MKSILTRNSNFLSEINFHLLGQGHSSELPSQWKHLPTLALPDGSHNYEADTAFFHLPDLEDPRKTIFGISCYRQIDASQVKNPTEDVTRGSVQKSVCVLSRLPLYGHIQVKWNSFLLFFAIHESPNSLKIFLG